MNQNFNYGNNGNNYNNGYNGFDFEYNYKRKSDALNVIKKHGILVGCCLIAFIAMSYVLVSAIRIFGVTELVQSNGAFSECIDIFYSVLGIFVPFLLIITPVKKYYHVASFGFNGPADKQCMILAVPAGLMLCLAGDAVSSYIVQFFGMFGINMNPVESDTPVSGAALVLYVLSAAIVAPLVEEFAVRGVALQPLRQYGEKFAVVITAFVFALMHQNIIQGIFAFFAGLVLGYFALSTGTVWTSVIIHALNNAFSIATYVISEKYAESSGYAFYNISNAVIFVVGIASLILFMKSKNRMRLTNCMIPYFKTGEKVKSFILTAPMIIAVIFMLVNTVSYISFG